MKMKHLTAIVTAALLTILVAAPASAELYPRVPRDWETTYGGASEADAGGNAPETAPAGWLPGDNAGEPLDTTAGFGDEERVLMVGDSVENGVVQGMPKGRLTGIFYDLAVVDIVVQNPTDPPTDQTVELYYAGLGRNPLPNAPANTGGRFEFYADGDIAAGTEDTDDAYFDRGGLAPIDWVENSGAPDVFPNINSAGDSFGAQASSGLWMQGTFREIGTTPQTGVRYVKKETLTLGTENGSLSGMQMVLTDGYAFDQGYFDGDIVVEADIKMPGTTGYQSDGDDGNWGVSASDPFYMPVASGINTLMIGGEAFAVNAGQTNDMHLTGVSSLYAPEPGMASLLGIGLLGLLLTGRRARKE